MSYLVDANNISKVSNVVVSAWTGGRPTDLIDLRLRPLEGVSAPVSGILVAGNFTLSDFRNTLKGDQMSDLIKLILDGHAYVRVQTNNAPLGEIVGKITPNVVRITLLFFDSVIRNVIVALICSFDSPAIIAISHLYTKHSSVVCGQFCKTSRTSRWKHVDFSELLRSCKNSRLPY